MKIRKVTKKDVPQMMEVVKLNNPKYPRSVALKEFNEMFSKSLQKPTYILIEKNGVVLAFAGFIHSWVDSAIVDIFWVNTHPDYMGMGLQKKLMGNIIKRIKKITKVRMIMLSTNIPKFYEKFGFRKTTTQYDRDYVLMEKRV